MCLCNAISPQFIATIPEKVTCEKCKKIIDKKNYKKKKINEIMQNAEIYEQQKSKEYTEEIAFKQLKRMGFKNLVKVDDTKNKFNPGIKTPDILLGRNKIHSQTFTNNPNDIYVDVVGITGAMWSQSNGKHPTLKENNIFSMTSKEQLEKVDNFIDILYSNETPYSFNQLSRIKKREHIQKKTKENDELLIWPIDVHNQDIIEQLMSPFNKKIEKYGSRKSNKNWIMQVESYMGGQEQLQHFRTLIELIFRHILDFLTHLDIITQEEALKHYAYAISIISGDTQGEIVLVGHFSEFLGYRKRKSDKPLIINGLFYKKDWMIISLIGTNLFKGTKIHFIDINALELNIADNSKEMQQIRKLASTGIVLYDLKKIDKYKKRA